MNMLKCSKKSKWNLKTHYENCHKTIYDELLEPPAEQTTLTNNGGAIGEHFSHSSLQFVKDLQPKTLRRASGDNDYKSHETGGGRCDTDCQCGACEKAATNFATRV